MASTIAAWLACRTQERAHVWLSLKPQLPEEQAENWTGTPVEVTKELGEGNQNMVFRLQCARCNATAALKVRKSQDWNHQSAREIPVLTCCQTIQGIPQLYWDGTISGDCCSEPVCLAMQTLGENLETLLAQRGGRMSSRCVAKIGYQLLATMRGLHDVGVVFRGLKPENVCIGDGDDADQVYLIDFERAVPTASRYGSYAGSVRTCVFWSLWALCGRPYHPQDDVYSIGYLMLYLRVGRLPWDEHCLWHDRFAPVQELCQDENDNPLEEQFVSFMQHLGDLSTGQRPNYQYLQDLLWEVACGGQADRTDRETKEAVLKAVCYDWCAEDCVHKKPSPAEAQSEEDASTLSCACVCRAVPKRERGYWAVVSRCKPDLPSDEGYTSSESAEQPAEELEEQEDCEAGKQ